MQSHVFHVLCILCAAVSLLPPFLNVDFDIEVTCGAEHERPNLD